MQDSSKSSYHTKLQKRRDAASRCIFQIQYYHIHNSFSAKKVQHASSDKQNCIEPIEEALVANIFWILIELECWDLHYVWKIVWELQIRSCRRIRRPMMARWKINKVANLSRILEVQFSIENGKVQQKCNRSLSAHQSI